MLIESFELIESIQVFNLWETLFGKTFALTKLQSGKNGVFELLSRTARDSQKINGKETKERRYCNDR